MSGVVCPEMVCVCEPNVLYEMGKLIPKQMLGIGVIQGVVQGAHVDLDLDVID